LVLDRFQFASKHWIVERTFGWLDEYHRMRNADDDHPERSEAKVCIAMTT